MATLDPMGSPGPQLIPEKTEQETRNQTLWQWAAVAVAFSVAAFVFPKSSIGSLAITVARFALVLGILVFVHEWGHYQFARWGGMKVNRFAIGFPPWIYTKRYRGIDYSVGALPIGGMVDIAGLGSEEEMLGSGTGTDEALRRRRPRPPHGQREFQEAALGWRFATLFAGPFMNFVYAIFASIVLFSVIGTPKSTDHHNVTLVSPGGPADKAGIMVGDSILGVNGTRIDNVTKLKAKIDSVGPGGSEVLIVQRAGNVLNIPVHPIQMSGYNDSEKVVNSAIIGVRFEQTYSDYKRVSVFEAAKTGLYLSAASSVGLVEFLWRGVSGKLTDQEKAGVSGPVGIAQEVNMSANQGAFAFIFLTLMLTINLGLINLLPIPALDGGRILFLFYELIFRRPVDPRKENYAHMAGMVLVLAFMLFITVRDVLPYALRWIHHIT